MSSDPGKDPKIFCFGYGYTASFLAQHLSHLTDTLWRIAGTTRDVERQHDLRESGISAYLFDTDKPLGDPLYILDNTTHILISTPPDDDGDPVYNLHADDIRALKSLQWIGYLSTTGVYGNRDGGWVDEEAECRPTSKRGNRRVKAERQWLNFAKKHDLPLHIFRLSGIYGPGRSALDSLMAGNARRIEKPGHAFNRAYVKDIATTLYHSMTRPKPFSIYNIADDIPAPSHEVLAYAAKLLGQEAPPLVQYGSVDMAPMLHSFYRDNKRVSNIKIKDDLNVVLAYPSYKEGLEDCLALQGQITESSLTTK